MEAPSNRPAIITILCLFGFLGIAFTLPRLFSNTTQDGWYTPYLAATIVIGLISLIGLWYMKRWGLYLYALMFTINQVVLLLTDQWNFVSFLIPGFVIAAGISYYSEMD